MKKYNNGKLSGNICEVYIGGIKEKVLKINRLTF